ncbi:MAG: prepilin-type N-terminal cleavage/methylation domain-containing protein [Nitrospirae bacterium]|nr:prepilin-type N-terminal cleavage/methylation domain-containing protein [Nitrospirota bacterium]
MKKASWMSRSAGNNKGFSFIEMSLALTIMALVFAASFRLINTYKMQADVNRQAHNISMLATSIKNNAKLVMDASLAVCTSITTAYADDGWGWRHANCMNTSPFPVFDINGKVLTYNIDTANFSSAVNSIISNVAQYCRHTGQTATTVTFDCSALGISAVQYKTSSNPTVNTVQNTVNIFTTPHNNSTNADFLNFLDFPSAVYIQYNTYISNSGQTVAHNDMINATSDAGDDAYKLDMTDLYLDRVKKTRDNVINLDAALRGYAIGVMTSEFENVPPNGLSSQDTFFVPWIWQVLASSQANSLTLCNNATSCSSIITGTQWANAAQTNSFAQTWIWLTTNLLSSNTSYVADAFGNPLRIVVIANGCTGDVSTCTAAGPSGSNPPPGPQGSYLSTMVSASYGPRPPYSSLIVGPLCLSNAIYPDFCRWTVVYPN